jgi:hypothetical protein
VYRVVRVRRKGKHGSRQLVVELQEARYRVPHGLLLEVHHVFAALQAGAEVEEGVFDAVESRIPALLHGRHGLSRSARLRWRRFGVGVVPMLKGVPRCSSFDLSQPNQVPALEASLSMLKFPQGGIRRPLLEYIADWVSVSNNNDAQSSYGPWAVLTFVKAIHVELPYKGRDIGMFEV